MTSKASKAFVFSTLLRRKTGDRAGSEVPLLEFAILGNSGRNFCREKPESRAAGANYCSVERISPIEAGEAAEVVVAGMHGAAHAQGDRGELGVGHKI